MHLELFKENIRRMGLAEKIVFPALAILLLEMLFPHQAMAAENPITTPWPVMVEYSDAITREEPVKTERKTEPRPETKKSMEITVTAYSSTPDQTDGTPYITGSMTFVRDGVIAANFLPIGTKVRFPEIYGDKIFLVEDRMNARYWYRADIWMPSRQEAKQFGVKYTTIEIL